MLGELNSQLKHKVKKFLYDEQLFVSVDDTDANARTAQR